VASHTRSPHTLGHILTPTHPTHLHTLTLTPDTPILIPHTFTPSHSLQTPSSPPPPSSHTTHSLIVEVQLDEPLWVPRVGPRDIAMEIMALCVQLDSFILTSAHNVRPSCVILDHLRQPPLATHGYDIMQF